ncbi:MAG TPA: SIMPL domain-containing protein, partial [Gaiellaceae bacterium]|nr:SIMPL domain-containing protein [Gaiellaceae bacterium]
MKRIALVSLVLLGAAAVAGVGLPERAAAVDPAPGTLTVTGTGSVTSVPDRAELSFGVESQAASAKAALAANATELRRLIDALKAAGAKDVATQT